MVTNLALRDLLYALKAKQQSNPNRKPEIPAAANSQSPCICIMPSVIVVQSAISNPKANPKV
jgi:hypothetical protein